MFRVKIIKQLILGLTSLTVATMTNPGAIEASQVPVRWFLGNWNCTIDGRPARMNWQVASRTEQDCRGGICSSTEIAYYRGRFSDNGGSWVELASLRNSNSDIHIRYLGREQDNWYLRYTPSSRSARGYTTWRSNRYPLVCQKL
jgi:hypothetical protein